MQDKIRNSLNALFGDDWSDFTDWQRALAVLQARYICPDLSLIATIFDTHPDEIGAVIEDCNPWDEWLPYLWNRYIQGRVRLKITELLDSIADSKYPKQPADAIQVLTKTDFRMQRPSRPGHLEFLPSIEEQYKNGTED